VPDKLYLEHIYAKYRIDPIAKISIFSVIPLSNLKLSGAM
jgi:hypothetical protein